MSASDLSVRFCPVATAAVADPRRIALSISASTDSCNIRFSFFTITSGALSSKRCLRRLFLLITRRYKSFKSDVAYLPPSSGTIGLSAGGITGKIVKIIHSGRTPALIMLRISFSRRLVLRASSGFDSARYSCSIVFANSDKSTCSIKRLTASAPIPASNTSPYFIERLR